MQALSLAQASEDSSDASQAIKLLLCTSINNLPFLPQNSAKYFSQTLLALAKARGDDKPRGDGGRNQESQGSQEAENGSSNSVFIDAMRGDVCAGEWVRNLLVFYKHRLRDGMMMDCAVAVGNILQQQVRVSPHSVTIILLSLIFIMIAVFFTV